MNPTGPFTKGKDPSPFLTRNEVVHYYNFGVNERDKHKFKKLVTIIRHLYTKTTIMNTSITFEKWRNLRSFTKVVRAQIS